MPRFTGFGKTETEWPAEQSGGSGSKAQIDGSARSF
jgi:hypothetical protein